MAQELKPSARVPCAMSRHLFDARLNLLSCRGSVRTLHPQLIVPRVLVPDERADHQRHRPVVGGLAGRSAADAPATSDKPYAQRPRAVAAVPTNRSTAFATMFARAASNARVPQLSAKQVPPPQPAWRVKPERGSVQDLERYGAVQIVDLPAAEWR